MKNNIFIGMYMCGMWGIPIILTQKMDLDLTVSIFLLLGFGLIVGEILGFVNNNYVKKLFSATLYTGNGSSSARNIDTGVAADLVWIKRRDADSMRNMWYDSSRGVGKYMHTDTDAAEDTSGTSLSAFNSNGFQLSDNGTYLNASGGTYVAWNWRANGATTSTKSNG